MTDLAAALADLLAADFAASSPVLGSSVGRTEFRPPPRRPLGQGVRSPRRHGCRAPVPPRRPRRRRPHPGRGHRPRPRPLCPARPPDPRPVPRLAPGTPSRIPAPSPAACSRSFSTACARAGAGPDAAVARLARAGDAIDAGHRQPDPALAHPLIVERGMGARGAARYVRDLVWRDVEDPAARAPPARPARRPPRTWTAGWRILEAFLPRAHGSWQLGEAGHTAILQERETLGDDARSLRERGRAELVRLDAEMRTVARAAPATTTSRSDATTTRTTRPPSPRCSRPTPRRRPAPGRSSRRPASSRSPPARPALSSRRPCSSGRCSAWRRTSRRRVLGPASAATSSSPSPPTSTPEAEVQARLANNSYGSIPTTSVHEAYPGHHWHLVMRKANPSDVRRVFSTPYFAEGWALYAERVMRERGFYEEPIHELNHLKATLFRAARIVVDTSLHLGEMTFDEAVAFMVGPGRDARSRWRRPRSVATAGGRPRRRPTSRAASRSCASASATWRRAATRTRTRPTSRSTCSATSTRSPLAPAAGPRGARAVLGTIAG